MKKEELKIKLDDLVWKLMVGCAKGHIFPKEKDEYVNQILAINKPEIDEEKISDILFEYFQDSINPNQMIEVSKKISTSDIWKEDK